MIIFRYILLATIAMIKHLIGGVSVGLGTITAYMNHYQMYQESKIQRPQVQVVHTPRAELHTDGEEPDEPPTPPELEDGSTLQ